MEHLIYLLLLIGFLLLLGKLNDHWCQTPGEALMDELAGPLPGDGDNEPSARG